MDPRNAPRGEMDHSTIQESQVPDRYLMGTLPAGERVEFEEHYLDCPVCLEYLESVEGLRAGLKELSPAPSEGLAARGGLPRGGGAAVGCVLRQVSPDLRGARERADGLRRRTEEE